MICLVIQLSCLMRNAEVDKIDLPLNGLTLNNDLGVFFMTIYKYYVFFR